MSERVTGEGQFVDVAMSDAVLAMCERIVYQTSYTGTVPAPEGNRHPLLCPFGVFRARDGYVSIAGGAAGLGRAGQDRRGADQAQQHARQHPPARPDAGRAHRRDPAGARL
ncbi:CoA transferase [Cupriavidus sp. BIC8F]|uniref:CoA transferase n=1 Tax=Cupriavidus sp. BIC8F TaxID=3079014 RepID=UPI003967BFFC